jgi:hypothetical protein
MDGVRDPNDDDENLEIRVVLLAVCGEIVPYLGTRHCAFICKQKVLSRVLKPRTAPQTAVRISAAAVWDTRRLTAYHPERSTPMRSAPNLHKDVQYACRRAGSAGRTDVALYEAMAGEERVGVR